MLIAVEGIQVIGNHGIYTEERKYGNIFQVDVYLQVKPRGNIFNDNIQETINYKEIYEMVLETMRTPKNLLETLCWEMAQEMLQTWDTVSEVKLRVAKLRPRYMEQCEKAFVELRFQRDNLMS